MTNPFTRHPREVGESYGEHMAAASNFGFTMLFGGICALIHGVFPFLFVKTGSRTMKSLQRQLSRRTDRLDWERHPII